MFLNRLAKSLQREALYDAQLQPFMAHIPFVLQFFIEHAIFGMGMIDFRRVAFRKPPKLADGSVDNSVEL